MAETAQQVARKVLRKHVKSTLETYYIHPFQRKEILAVPMKRWNCWPSSKVDELMDACARKDYGMAEKC